MPLLTLWQYSLKQADRLSFCAIVAFVRCRYHKTTRPTAAQPDCNSSITLGQNTIRIRINVGGACHTIPMNILRILPVNGEPYDIELSRPEQMASTIEWATDQYFKGRIETFWLNGVEFEEPTE